MAVSLTSLLTPIGRTAMVDSLLSVASSLGLPTTSWQAGQPMRTMLTTIGQKLADFTEVLVTITQGGFGDLATDGWADLWAQSIYDEERIPAEPATGLVNCANTSASNYILAAGELIVAHATTGQTYRNTAPITILAAVGLDDIAVQADEVGVIGNAAPGTITVVVTSLVGVSSTNPLSVLGADAELTPALVKRCRAKLASLSPNGPKDAYNYIATTPEFSAVATPITRTNTTASPTTGAITVYLATAAGAPVAGDVTIVQAALDEWAEPWTATATAQAAAEQVVPVTYQAWVTGSQLTDAQIEAEIGAALAVWFSSLDIGGYVIPPDTGAIYIDSLQQAIGLATPGILRVAVTLPAATVTIAPQTVAVLGAVIATITKL
jgi:phage-related baseplate assembly protein